MKNKLQIHIVLFFAITTILFGACKKNDAPKVTSATFSVSSWAFSSPNYYTNLSVPELTSSNINSAAVMVYFSTTSGVWTALPYTEYYQPSDYHMNFNSRAGQVTVLWFYDGLSNGSDPNAFYGTTVQCKVVVVPESAREANPDVDYKSYKSVKTTFNLKD